MRLTIVADDNCVSVDGLSYLGLDLQELDPEIHAVQWYENYGEIEYKTRMENGALLKKANLFFNDLTPFQNFVEIWNSAHEAALKAALPTQPQGLIPVTEV